ncbi:MAG: hypothetical protein K2X93_26350 [Candidatus Obscuribacterales bacterium]|nr:hypothetical protein [Candidatus Obscuribacterales bacterium]
MSQTSDRVCDQQDLIANFDINSGDQIELTPQTVHSGVYHNNLKHGEQGQLKIKRSGPSSKVQHNLALGEENFIRASFGEVRQTKLGGALSGVKPFCL